MAQGQKETIKTMELKDFIKTAITDITSAISELQGSLSNGAIINPTLPNPIANHTVAVDNSNLMVETIRFDVAVSASVEKSTEGKFGINVLGAAIGKDKKAEETSRITFEIPVVLPVHRVKSQNEKDKEEYEEKNRKHHQSYLDLMSSYSQETTESK